jgi:hypothetical protein
MTNKHLHADVRFHPDDNAHFDRSLDEHDDRRGGDVGRGWCQGAVYVGVVDDPPHLPGDAHPRCRRVPDLLPNPIAPKSRLPLPRHCCSDLAPLLPSFASSYVGLARDIP